MNNVLSSVDILMAEDDPEDQMLVREAFEEAHAGNRLFTVSNGELLMDYLFHRPPYEAAALPNIILLDLNMPRKNGREALTEIKAAPALRHIPIIVLTTSGAEEDILRSYDLGVSSYIRKPVTFGKLIAVVTALRRYWFETVELPDPHSVQGRCRPNP